jgi:hypothetical protein
MDDGSWPALLPVPVPELLAVVVLLLRPLPVSDDLDGSSTDCTREGMEERAAETLAAAADPGGSARLGCNPCTDSTNMLTVVSMA